VEDVLPDFVDPSTQGPIAGREEEWSLMTEYRVHLAEDERNWPEAERLQQLDVDWNRKRAQPALAVMQDRRDATDRNVIRTLAASLHELAEIQREQGRPTCAETYRETLDLADAIDDTAAQAICAFNLGHTYKDIAGLRDLDEAERWYRRSLDLRAPGDGLGRGRCLSQLGSIAYDRFRHARNAKRPPEELARHLTEAAQLYEQALEMTPRSAIRECGVKHNALGTIYAVTGDIDRALHHYQQDIRYCELGDDIFGAGQTRRSAAITLVQADRMVDARAYAEAALANFRTFGDRAAAEIQQALQLIAHIDQAMADKVNHT